MDKLLDLVHILRSKNAGPLKLTLDLMFSEKNTYERVKNSNAITTAKIAEIYQVEESNVEIIDYDIANAIKVTFNRHMVSGDIFDDDVYGCQQHVPLGEILIP